MLVELPNRLKVINVTPHDLVFDDQSWIHPIRVPTHVIVNAKPVSYVQWTRQSASSPIEFVFVDYEETAYGRKLIDRIKEEFPDAVIVGSVVASRAYAGDIVTPVPLDGTREQKGQRSRLMRADRFSVFPKAAHTLHTQQEKIYNGNL